MWIKLYLHVERTAPLPCWQRILVSLTLIICLLFLVAKNLGKTIPRWSFCDTGAECSFELHWVTWCQTWCDKGKAYQICKGDPSEGNASSCWCQWFLWNQESLLLRVSDHLCFYNNTPLLFQDQHPSHSNIFTWLNFFVKRNTSVYKNDQITALEFLPYNIFVQMLLFVLFNVAHWCTRFELFDSNNLWKYIAHKNMLFLE